MEIDLSIYNDRTNMEKALRRLVYTDRSVKEIAEELGIAPGTIYNYKDKPNYEQMLSGMEEDKYRMERSQIGRLVPKAIQTYTELLQSKNDNIRYAAARDILDRTGHKAVEKKETTLKGSVDISERARIVEKYLKGEDEDEDLSRSR